MNRPTLSTRFFFLFLTFFSLRTYSQHRQFTNFTELNGLPSSETYQVFQDKEGFIWIATDNGVVKYDGEKFQHYNMSHGLTDNTVFGFYEDEKGRIWFRTYSGAICYYDNGKIRPYKYNELLQRNVGTGLLTDLIVKDETLWFAGWTSGSISNSGEFTPIKDSIDLVSVIGDTHKTYAYVMKVHDQFLSGLVGYSASSARRVEIDGKLYGVELGKSKTSTPLILEQQWNGTHYISINNCVFEYRSGHLNKVITYENAVVNIGVDRHNELWIGLLNEGVRKYSHGNFKAFAVIDDIESNSVSSVLNDKDDGYWISTLDRGVFYFPNLKVLVKNFSNSGYSKLSAIARGRDFVFIGAYDGTVSKMNSPFKEEFLLKTQAPIRSLYQDKMDILWGSNGIETFKFFSPQVIHHQKGISAAGFISDSSGNVIGYGPGGIFKFDQQGKIFGRNEIAGRAITGLAKDSTIYLGSLTGLQKYDLNLEPLGRDETLVKARISSLEPLGRDEILVGTIGKGIYILEGDVARPMKNFPALNVYSILVCNNQIWTGTERGLIISSSLSNKPVELTWREIDQSSGLLSNKCTNLAPLGKDILVFSDEGISVVPQNISTFSNEKPISYIKSQQVNNITIDKINELEPYENNIDITAGAISFNNRSITYRHRVNELDEWNYSETGNISYFNLRPGSYKIEIEASTNAKEWHPIKRPIEFTINPPWWGTWIFRGILIALLLMLAYAIYLMRLNALRRKQRYLELINSHQQRLIDSEIETQERERRRIAKDLHDGVGTALSSIKMMATDVINPNTANQAKRARDISENLTEVIADIKRIIYDLHPPALERYGLKVGLKNLVEKINVHGSVSVTLDYYGNREVSSKVSTTVYRIVQELINNTLRHAKATEIRIHVNHFDEEINVMYEDNGIGMVGSSFTGLGLYSIESRVQSLQGRMTWESNHRGTFYNFDIPI